MPKAKASDDELRALAGVLNLSPEWLVAEVGPRWYPNRGIGPIPPTDPVIYRLFEASQRSVYILHRLSRLCFVQGVLVYGHAIKVR